jgi:hypothetical protein
MGKDLPRENTSGNNRDTQAFPEKQTFWALEWYAALVQPPLPHHYAAM